MKSNKEAARIYEQIKIGKTILHTLFDSGARRNYITFEAAKKANLEILKLPHLSVLHSVEKNI